jgi:hypothetical protein
MKKIIILLAVIGMFGFQGCEGPEGPPGQDGLIGGVIEITDVSFTSSNNFNIVRNFAPIYDTDMILVYRLSGVNNGVDIWSLVPETHYFPDGTLDFNYDFEFTKSSVNIFMGGSDLGTVPNEFRINQIFRIVILPADFTSSVDKNNYKAVINSLNIKENQIQKIDIQ